VLSEPALRDAHRTLATRYGLWVEPAAAASLAALLELRERGDVRAGDTAVLLLTGSGLKDPDAWTR
jgi:threonine synthase